MLLDVESWLPTNVTVREITTLRVLIDLLEVRRHKELIHGIEFILGHLIQGLY